MQIGKINSVHGKDKEGYELPAPKAVRRLTRLAYRALTDEKVTISSTAEVLGLSIVDVRNELTQWYQGVEH